MARYNTKIDVDRPLPRIDVGYQIEFCFHLYGPEMSLMNFIFGYHYLEFLDHKSTADVFKVRLPIFGIFRCGLLIPPFFFLIASSTFDTFFLNGGRPLL